MLKVATQASGVINDVKFSSIKYVHRLRCRNGLCCYVNETDSLLGSNSDQFIKCSMCGFTSVVSADALNKCRVVFGTIGGKILQIPLAFIPENCDVFKYFLNSKFNIVQINGEIEDLSLIE